MKPYQEIGAYWIYLVNSLLIRYDWCPCEEKFRWNYTSQENVRGKTEVTLLWAKKLSWPERTPWKTALSFSPSDGTWSCQLQNSTIQNTDNKCLLCKPLNLIYNITATSAEKCKLGSINRSNVTDILLPKIEEMKFILQVLLAYPASHFLELKVYRGPHQPHLYLFKLMVPHGLLFII